MERSILGLRITDRMLHSKTGIVGVGKKAARLKWDWAGHANSMHEVGRRRRGQPRSRWRDDLDAHCWSEVALKKRTWKDMREAFVQQWDIKGN